LLDKGAPEPAVGIRRHISFTTSYGRTPDPDDAENVVDLSFRDLGGSTKVVLIQAPFKTEAHRQLHRDGWTDSFDKLERLISDA
jgi:uncharacterized protein YndB with AHSA1/START domain